MKKFIYGFLTALALLLLAAKEIEKPRPIAISTCMRAYNSDIFITILYGDGSILEKKHEDY